MVPDPVRTRFVTTLAEARAWREVAVRSRRTYKQKWEELDAMCEEFPELRQSREAEPK